MDGDSVNIDSAIPLKEIPQFFVVTIGTFTIPRVLKTDERKAGDLWLMLNGHSLILSVWLRCIIKETKSQHPFRTMTFISWSFLSLNSFESDFPFEESSAKIVLLWIIYLLNLCLKVSSRTVCF